ncbi:MAG: hypothetical protein Q7R64_04445 [bacterium]|nr:hypothetical protein [bacterium]
MQQFSSTGKKGMARSLALSLVFSTLFIAVSVGAATTISTNISTGGTLSVTGASTLTGLTTMVYASSTGQSLTGNLQVAGGLAVGSAMTNGLAGTILFSAQSSDPTGVTQGTFYYNSTNKTLKMYDGTDWFTVGTTTSGISLSGSRLQLADLTLQFLTIGTTTQQGVGKSMVTLEATSTASIPLSLVGRSGQTGHLFDVLKGGDIAGAKLLFIDSTGGLFGSSTAAFGSTLTVGGTLTATTSAHLATTAGSVGVGTTTPGTTFSVQGNGIVSGSLTAATFVASTTGISVLPYASTTAVTMTGTASTSQLIVGGDGTNGLISGAIFGTCHIVQRYLTATSTGGFACTTATGITTSFKVFVSATSTLAGHATSTLQGAGFVIGAASSTALNTIGVELSNLTGAAAFPAGTLNFWAVR